MEKWFAYLIFLILKDVVHVGSTFSGDPFDVSVDFAEIVRQSDQLVEGANFQVWYVKLPVGRQL